MSIIIMVIKVGIMVCATREILSVVTKEIFYLYQIAGQAQCKPELVLKSEQSGP